MSEPTKKTKSEVANGSVQQLVRCASCKWWEGRCLDEPTYRKCKHPKTYGYTTPPDGFGSFDGEPNDDGGGSFASGPDFGCVHGERVAPNAKSSHAGLKAHD